MMIYAITSSVTFISKSSETLITPYSMESILSNMSLIITSVIIVLI